MVIQWARRPCVATTTRLRWSTVCWTQLRRRVQTLNLKIRLNSRTISSFRLYAFAFVRRHIHHALLLPTPSITMYAGPKQWLLISVFRAQNSFSSLTNTISLFLNQKESKSPARDTNKIDKLRYSTRRILEQRCHADTCNLQPAHPISSLFSQLLISRNLQGKDKREENAHWEFQETIQ